MAHQPPAAQPTHQHEHDGDHGVHWHQGSPGYFDESARTWDTPDKIERSRLIAEAVLEAVPVEDTWTVLDYGCGTGQLAWHLGPRVSHVTLADVSEGMLEVAREGATRDPGRYEVVHHDLTVAPLPRLVHLAVSAMALHHVADTDAALRNLHASLLPGGWVAIADLDADPENHFHDDGFDGHLGFDRHELLGELGRLGFTDLAERTASSFTKEKNGQTHRHQVFLVTGRRS
ncbi:MAG: class I SAM-dependent methyltransferase [Actinomycetes bacterium]